MSEDQVELGSEYECDKYICTPETAKETLEKYGVAIVPDILDDGECDKMLDGFWGFLEKISKTWDEPISRKDESTWRSFWRLFPLHSFLIQRWGIGQSQVVWDVRQNPKVVNVFAKIWGCEPEELLTSFDGASFGFPPEKTRRGWNRNNTWYHSDQSYTRNELECIQGWISGLDVNKGDATLSFYEGSHKFHGECAQKFNITEKKNWYKLNREEETFYKEKCECKKIKCPKGCLVLWDSRTIHCGVEAYKWRTNPNFRAVVYTCYQKRSIATKAQLRKK